MLLILILGLAYIFYLIKRDDALHVVQLQNSQITLMEKAIAVVQHLNNLNTAIVQNKPCGGSHQPIIGIRPLIKH